MPSGMDPVAVKYETLTVLVFWRMNTSRSISTKAPAITPTHAAEIRVRSVWCPEEVPLTLGSVGAASC
jgi:hypothetical protein